MVKYQTQKGSLLAVVLVVLSVGVAVALGFVFWAATNSSVAPSGNSTAQSEPSTQEAPKLLTASTHEDFAKKVSWQYPETWELRTEGGGPKHENDVTQQFITILSPTKQYEVEIRVGAHGGIGGSCDADSPAAIQHIKRYEMDEPEYVFVEHITDSWRYNYADESDARIGYYYYAGILNNSERVKNAEIGSQACSTYLQEVLDIVENNEMRILYARVNFKQVDQQENKYADKALVKDADAIKQLFSTDEYRRAVDILRSMSVED